MHDPPGACRSRGHELRIGQPGDQGFLTEHVETCFKRLFDERCMAARRCTDVDEIERLVGQQVVHAVVPAAVGACFKKGVAPRRQRIGRRHDRDITARLPPRQVPFCRDIAEPDKCAPQHASPSQSSPNLRAMAANDTSRMSIPNMASSSLMTSGGLMRMTCEYDIVMRPRSNASWNRARVIVLSRGSLVVRSATISTPIIKPRPRTSPMKRYFSCSCFRELSISAPTRAEFSTSFSSRMISTAPSPAAAASGFPPKLDELPLGSPNGLADIRS